MKARIRKDGDRWQVTAPGYGFNRPQTVEVSTWEEAIRRVSGPSTPCGSAGVFERDPDVVAHRQLYIG